MHSITATTPATQGVLEKLPTSLERFPIGIQETPERDDLEMRVRLDAWRSRLDLQSGYVQMPNSVREDPSLSKSAKIIYEELLHYARQDDSCWPSQKVLAKKLGMHRSTVIRAIQELEARYYIDKVRRGFTETNKYYINPVTFVQSFRRAAVDPELEKAPFIEVGSAEQRATVVNTPRPNVFASYEMLQNATSGSSKKGLLEVAKCDTTKIHEEEDTIYKEKDTTRSGRAAQLGVKGAALAIRSTIDTKETGTNGDTKQERENTKSNTPTMVETGGAGAAKEASQVKGSKRKRHQKGEIPPPLPSYLEDVLLRPLSLRFCDQARESSKTSFAWIFAEMRKRGQDEYSELFCNLVNEARDITIEKTSRGLITGLNRDGSIAQMPYFLTILEINVDRWCEAYDKFLATQPLPTTSTPEPESVKEEEPADEKGEDRQQLPTTSTPEEQAEEIQGSPAASVQEEVVTLDIVDPTAGWSLSSAEYYALLLLDYLSRDAYRTTVLPTRCPGRYGVVLIERSASPTQETFTSSAAVNARIRR